MATSMTIIKRMTYRGDANEEWSNKYYLDGADPADASEWSDIFDALAAAEKTCYTMESVIVRAYGYTSDASTAASVWSKDLTVTGPTISGTHVNGGSPTSGDQAGMVWWKTDRLSSTGKPIYLRKYFHNSDTTGNQRDALHANMISAYEAFATLLASGAGVDGRHIRGPGQASETIYDSGAGPWITTRTLKRRGRRPLPSP